jgi:glycosyltransferase involved in cell wall biosynthesis
VTPRVSILTPVYNGERFLSDTIKSVLAQEMPDWELIISDNVSTDRSAEIAQCYAQQDPRIRFFRNDVHVTAVENFNLCYHRSTPDSTYVALLASDDWWEPSFLARTVAIAEERPELAYVYTDMYRTDAEGRILNRYSAMYRHNTPPPGEHHALPGVFYGTFINIMAALINRAVKAHIYPTHDLLDASLPLTPDNDLWVHLITRGGRGYYIAEPLAYYRKHAGAMTLPARIIPRLQGELTTLRDKLEGVCLPEFEVARREAVQQRYASIGFELLASGRADEAREALREAHLRCNGRRRDVAVARLIAGAPGPQGGRARLWQLVLGVGQRLGKPGKNRVSVARKGQ